MEAARFRSMLMHIAKVAKKSSGARTVIIITWVAPGCTLYIYIPCYICTRIYIYIMYSDSDITQGSKYPIINIL